MGVSQPIARRGFETGLAKIGYVGASTHVLLVALVQRPHSQVLIESTKLSWIRRDKTSALLLMTIEFALP